MAEVKNKTVEEFIEAARGANAVLRKIASRRLDRVFGMGKLKKEWRRANAAAAAHAEELETQSQKAICADDLMDLAGIICRATNTPLDAFTDILSALEVEITK